MTDFDDRHWAGGHAHQAEAQNPHLSEPSWTIIVKGQMWSLKDADRGTDRPPMTPLRVRDDPFTCTYVHASVHVRTRKGSH